MAVRIRKDKKTIVCAAKSGEKEGDVYLNDSVQYALHVDMKILCWRGLDKNGADLWEFDTENGKEKYKTEFERIDKWKENQT